jgi:hypothetical protein
MKMIKKLLVLMFVCYASHAFAGNNISYQQLIDSADHLYNLNDYKNAAVVYDYALNMEHKPVVVEDYINAAAANAMIGNNKRAFHLLFYITRRQNFYDIELIQSVSALTALHNDTDWEQLLNTMRKKKEKIEHYYNYELIHELDTLNADDQKYRLAQIDTASKYGWDASQTKDMYVAIEQADSINRIKVSRIFEKYQWPDKQIIGEKRSITLFIVLQHAPIAYQEKYLSLIEKAYKTNNIRKPDYALFIDRIAVNKGQSQIYGSQILFKNGEGVIAPLKYPKRVDKLRKKMGLPTLEEYIKLTENLNHIKIKYDPKNASL